MEISSERVKIEGPVHFRVLEAGSTELRGLPVLRPSDEFFMHIEWVNGQGKTWFGLFRHMYEPHRDALQEAAASGAVYWYELPDPKTTNFLRMLDHTVTDYLLDAIQQRRIVTADESSESETAPGN